MTYLGYQVRHLESCGEQVQEWLDSHANDNLQVSYQTPVASTSELFIGNLSAFDKQDFDNFKSFESSEVECSFCTESHQYTVKVAHLPADKWGNTATFDSEPSCSCIWLNYCDDSGNYPNEEYRHILDNIDEEYEYELSDFIEWVNNLRDERVGKIEEEVTCSGTSNSWYYTTIKDEGSLNELVREYVQRK